MKKLLLLIAVIMSFVSLTSATGLTGSGTLADPYQISTAADLDLVRNNLAVGTYYKLMNDIDLTTYLAPGGAGYIKWTTSGWLPIPAFLGVLDGDNHKITGLKINRTSTNNIGLFGTLGQSSTSSPTPTVKNLGVVIDGAASVSGGTSFVGGLSGLQNDKSVISNCYVSGAVIGPTTTSLGGLVGESYGTVQDSYTEGSVTGNSGGSQIGGLIGRVAGGLVARCYSTSNVSGDNSLGGLCGITAASGSITDCFARGSVTSTSDSYWVGGLIGGDVSWSVTRCYSTGLVVTGSSWCGGLFGATPSPAATNSFWDITTSNQSTSKGLGEVGKTTTEMKTQSTFTNASWNFSTTWAISPSTNNGYPYLITIPLSPLPVELTSFTASTEKNGIALNWKTATETNNYGFEIQRSAISTQQSDNVWLKIGFVEGNGTTNAPKSYSFTDKSANGKTSYRLKQIDRDGKFEYSQTVEVTAAIAPKEFSLEQNYPNPFNPTTSISYQLSANSFTTLKIYDAIGREVATLVNDVKEAGTYSAQFDGAKLSSGIYFANLTSSGKTQMRKLLLLK